MSKSLKYYFTSNFGGGGSNVSRVFNYYKLIKNTKINILLNYFYLETNFKKTPSFNTKELNILKNYNGTLINFLNDYGKNNIQQGNFSNKFKNIDGEFLPEVFLDSGAGNLLKELGYSDINKKTLRTPLDPDETFSEDPLRMMRAAYFASKLGFIIEKECRVSMKRQAYRIDIVSWERIRDEFIKILKTKKPSIGLVILQKIGIMKTVFPEIHIMYGMEQTSEWHHKDIFAHTLQVVDNAAELTNKMEIRFAALVHDIAKPNTRRIDEKKGYTFHGHDAIGERMLNKVASRLKLPNTLKEYLKKLTLLHLRPIALVKDIVTDSAVRRLMFAAGDDLDDLMILCRADITTKNPNRVKQYLKNFKKVEEKMSNVTERDAMKAFQSPVRGAEIMEICGLTEGRKVGEVKEGGAGGAGGASLRVAKDRNHKQLANRFISPRLEASTVQP